MRSKRLVSGFLWLVLAALVSVMLAGPSTASGMVAAYHGPGQGVHSHVPRHHVHSLSTLGHAAPNDDAWNGALLRRHGVLPRPTAGCLPRTPLSSSPVRAPPGPTAEAA